MLEPVHKVGYDYAISYPGGARLLTIASNGLSIGGHPGRMWIAPEVAADVELPALVAIGFTIANEQFLRVHWSAAPYPFRSSRSRA
jgi:hypothetical protein